MTTSKYPTIEAGGEIRVLSALPRRSKVGDRQCCSGVLGADDAPAILPIEECPDEIDPGANVVRRIRNQGQHNLCWGEGATGAHETALGMDGMADIALSMGHLVGQVNGGIDEGDAVDATLPTLLQYGQAPASLVPDMNFHPRTWPANAAEEAAKFRIKRVFDLGHQQQILMGIITALVRGPWPTVLGTTAWGGGHCVYALAYFEGHLRNPMKMDFAGPNSWGSSTDWQWAWKERPGWWRMPGSMLYRYLPTFGAWALQSNRPNPDDLPK
jgi:hypothetical protein